MYDCVGCGLLAFVFHCVQDAALQSNNANLSFLAQVRDLTALHFELLPQVYEVEELGAADSVRRVSVHSDPLCCTKSIQPYAGDVLDGQLESRTPGLVEALSSSGQVVCCKAYKKSAFRRTTVMLFHDFL